MVKRGVWLLMLGALFASPVQGQDSKVVKRGQRIWDRKRCAACHGLHSTHGGPPLAGVEQRRSKDWLYRWLNDSETMVRTDSIGREMLARWRFVMPSQKLSTRDTDALLAFLRSKESRPEVGG
jgi:mono/diheme cytochrome c family protein